MTSTIRVVRLLRFNRTLTAPRSPIDRLVTEQYRPKADIGAAVALIGSDLELRGSRLCSLLFSALGLFGIDIIERLDCCRNPLRGYPKLAALLDNQI